MLFPQRCSILRVVTANARGARMKLLRFGLHDAALRWSCVETGASYGRMRCVRRPESNQEKRDDAEAFAWTGGHRLPGIQ